MVPWASFCLILLFFWRASISSLPANLQKEPAPPLPFFHSIFFLCPPLSFSLQLLTHSSTVGPGNGPKHNLMQFFFFINFPSPVESLQHMEVFPYFYHLVCALYGDENQGFCMEFIWKPYFDIPFEMELKPHLYYVFHSICTFVFGRPAVQIDDMLTTTEWGLNSSRKMPHFNPHQNSCDPNEDVLHYYFPSSAKIQCSQQSPS